MSPDATSNVTNERLLRIVRQHWVKYLRSIFLYVFFTILSTSIFIAAGAMAYHTVWLSYSLFVLALVLFLVVHHWFFTTLLCELAVHIIITNRRVIWIRDSLFLDERMTEYSFNVMHTVEARKHGILQTLLRYGTLKFGSGADIPLIPHPIRIAKEIEQAMGMR